MSSLKPIPRKDELLSLEYFDEKPRAYSTRIVKRLVDSPLFRPKRDRHDQITDHDMLTIASTVVASADERIEQLERKASVLNGPMFGKGMTVADEDTTPPTTEPHWILKYLTLRNFISATVVLSAALWTIFTFYSADKNLQVEHLGKQVKQLEDDVDYAQKQTSQYKAEAAEAQKHKGEVDSELSSLKGTEAAERKDLEGSKSQIKDLLATIQKQATGSTSPAASQ